MKKILVLTDFSEYAENALEIATKITKLSEGEIVLIHVIPSITSASLFSNKSLAESNIEKEYMKYVKETSEAHLEKVKENKKFKEFSIQVEVFIGDLFKIVKKIIPEKSIDLLVMGTRGASGLDEVLIGSNTEKIVRNVEVPVLSTRQKVQNFDIKNIVFATTLKDDQINVLQQVQEFQKIFDAKIHLLYVNTPANFLSTKEIQLRRDKVIAQTNLKNYTVATYSSVNEELGIKRFADDVEADVIAMATQQRKGLAHYFWGSLTEDLVNHVTRPVLTFKLS